MPVLFGNTYILPAIIVVVLLVLFLLVIVLRKRGSSSSTPKTAATPERWVASPPTSSRAQGAPVQARPEAKISPTDRSAAAPAVAESSRAEAAPHTDPLTAVILDILQGWGDIADDDTKRLALFRPEKVLADLQAIAIPKELKSSKHAQTRLTQLRQYASARVDHAREQQAAALPWVEAEPVAASAAPAVSAVPVMIPEPAKPSAEPAAAFETVEVAQTPLVETDYADELSTWPEIEVTIESTESTVSPPLAAPIESRFEAPAEAPVEIPIEAPVEMPGQETSWLQQDTQTTPKWQPEGDAMFLEEPESSLSSLHLSIKTADELLALPVGDRPDMVAFLEPAELSKVFVATNDPGLKRAIIETLEHVSNPASLEILRRCLDDPDPQIQLYALEAADRLLGVD